MRIVRLIAVSLLLLIGTLWQSAPARALAPRPLTGADFFNYSELTQFVGDLSIDADHYKGGISMGCGGAYRDGYASLSAHALLGYNAVVFKVGFLDSHGNGTGELHISRDNRPYRTVLVHDGTVALPVQILFAGAHTIELSASCDSHWGATLGLAEPMAILATGRGVTLALGATSVQPGALLPIAVTTAPGAPVTLVISYPGGGQRVIGPTPAPASGKFSYTLRVPETVHGTVGVFLVTGGVSAQASFTAG